MCGAQVDQVRVAIVRKANFFRTLDLFITFRLAAITD
jgi:hypothetical protein